MLKRLMSYLGLTVLLLLLLPAAALAVATPAPSPTFALPTAQVITLCIAGLVPLITYILNHYAPWTGEKVKGLVLVLAAAVSGGLVQAIDTTGSVGFNNTTLQYVYTAVIGALTAHKLLWNPSGIAEHLGGGSNR